MRAKGEYPKDIQEFMDQGWTKEIYYRIRVFNLKDALNNPEDLVQDILVSLMQTKYIDRYTVDKGSFSTYIYGFIDNFLRKKYNKEHTRHGKFIVSAASLVTGSPEAESEFDGREVYSDLIDSGIDIQREILIKEVIEEIRKELAENFEANSSYENNGVVYQRDPLTVFNLLMEGKVAKDIADILGVSCQFIYHLVSKIKKCKAAKEIFKDL